MTDFIDNIMIVRLVILYYIIIILVLVLILLSGYVDPLNKFLKRTPIDDNLRELYVAKHLKGSNDGRVIDLSFFNASLNFSNPDPDRPSKIIFDKNDSTGSLLTLLFPYERGHLTVFTRDGIVYKGISHPNFGIGHNEAGIMERVNADNYHITVAKPDSIVIQELNNRGISIFSGNLPLRSVEHLVTSENGEVNSLTCIYVYANRRDAIGVYNPNDPNILPSS
jgi:hypothetical protein